jgi:ubiquinone/menaquinone biosynthesis C-methylase UbiE
MNCRHCRAALVLPFLDLVAAPPSNAYLTEAQVSQPETWFPLRVLACTSCWLVQTEDYAHFESLFSSDYAYFSSFSTTWLEHAKSYVERMIGRFGLGPSSLVLEVASNDGYLLQHVKRHGVPCLGIEPTASTAQAARDKGIDVVQEFFGVALAERLRQEGREADLMTANNVLAHVPDINDFVAGFARLLAPRGVATFEFPHLMRLVADCQFDTVYHEHFSYLSLTAVNTIFERNGLTVFDVEEIATHGGSLRVYAQRRDTGPQPTAATVADMLGREFAAGVTDAAYYGGFQERADRIKDDLLEFLIGAKRAGKTVGAYGAAAKGNTLLNYAGVRTSLLPWVADRNMAKRGKYLPGSHIPVVGEAAITENQPDFVLILPWNLRAEIEAQLGYAREWGAKFVVAVPRLEIS